MLPKWHIFFGAVFTLLILYFAPDIKIIYLALVFFASVFIDFDHYITSVIKTKKLSLSHSLKYHKTKTQKIKEERKKGIRKKTDFHLFHTIEFHIFIAIIGVLILGGIARSKKRCVIYTL